MFYAFGRRRAASPDRAIALELLRAIVAMLPNSEPDPNIDHVVEQLQEHVIALADESREEIRPGLRDAITTACTSGIAVVDRHNKARRQDIAAFFAMVRESVNAMAAHNDSLSVALGKSIGRLQFPDPCQDLAKLRQLIAEEGALLRSQLVEQERTQRTLLTAVTHRLALAEEQLQLSSHEAFIDPLTRLANRRGFDVALERRIQELDPSTPMVLALFDVDDLRTVNKDLGQCAGDAVLRHVAGTIRQAVRPHDVVARIGGDEFALVASGLTLLQGQARLRQIVRAIADGSVTLGGQPVSVTCGAGELGAGDSLPSLLHRADLALQEAKRRGCGNVVTRMAPSIRSELHPAILGKIA